jgi:hypothetical protein
MAKANNDELALLHSKLAEVLKNQLEDPEVSPAFLNVARQFLKDNNIDSVAENANPMDLLKEAELPFQDNVVDIPQKRSISN